MEKPKSDDTKLWPELERKILHGLSCEWDRAAADLDPHFRKQFHKPQFALKDMKKQWGQWDGPKRMICLSRDLVRDHSWDAVREILFHEMSHQLAEEVLCAGNETAHGKTFHTACNLLRANPAASGSVAALDERVKQETGRTEDATMIRIGKLMALAQSDNIHEAEVAMAKAHYILEKHNLEYLEGPHDRKYESIFLGRPALRHFREHYHLSNLLQEFYFVFCIWVPAYVMEKGKMGNVLEVSGTPQNLKIAEYVYEFVLNTIHEQWRRYNKDKSLNRYRKTDFSVGIIQGFSEKLRSNAGGRIVQQKRSNALILAEDTHLKTYVKTKYPRVTHIRSRPRRTHKKVVKEGIGIGEKMVIYKGIERRVESDTLKIPLELDKKK